MSIIWIHTPGGDTEISFIAPASLAELLRHHGHPVEQPCGGHGQCGKCRVRATGALSAPDEAERRSLSESNLRRGVRLACRTEVLGDAEVWPEATGAEAIMTGFTLPSLPDHAEGVGLAVDVGTTTLAAYLYDLNDHRLLSVQSMPNPQRTFGADVISRLKAALEGRKEALRRAITGAIHTMATAALQAAARPEESLAHAVITGNTAMMYLLTGLDPSSIAFAPFKPASTMGQEAAGNALGLFPHTRVWLPECLSAYVGADITCAMVYAATRPEFTETPLLLADIGTNGEMALFTGERSLTCSTAAGPAFEGAGIRCGMTAREGAICQVELREGRINCRTVGDVHPTGLCGSGLVDAVAILREMEVIDETGRMAMTGHPLASCMETEDGQPAFRFPGTEVLLTQADVRALQLAKSAICAGMLTLLDAAGLSPADVRTFQLAGGFGSCIRPETAEAIGLIPSGFAAKTHALGNGAGAGAAMMLLSERARAEGAAIRQRQTTVELSTSPVFQEAFMDCMLLEACGEQ